MARCRRPRRPPGTYVFGDLMQTVTVPRWAGTISRSPVLATVVDRPEPGLALLDAGSKTLSGDRTSDGVHGALWDGGGPGNDVRVTRCSEEHGWATGAGTDALRVSERVRLVPAHVCPVVNLADEVTVIRGEMVVDRWRVAARGCVH
jgi:D-serine deaminase-like pyridoxal phosphate-dependent protein